MGAVDCLQARPLTCRQVSEFTHVPVHVTEACWRRRAIGGLHAPLLTRFRPMPVHVFGVLQSCFFTLLQVSVCRFEALH